MARKTKKTAARKPTDHVDIVYVPVEDLIPDEDNPNEMDEATFDALVEEIAEQGFDEPIHIRRHPTMEGKYQISSGHHRTRAAMVNGMVEVPAIIKEFTDREQKVALVKRNALRGDLNKTKLTTLYRDLAKGKDATQVQRELGITNPKKFEAMVDKISSELPPKQRKKLQDAKETIKSVDDLSSVLNKIFKEAGSELDKGYMVFSFGGKKHHYFQIDDATNKKLEAIIAHCEKNGITYTEFMQSIVADVDLPASVKPVKKKVAPKTRKRPEKKE